MKPLLLFAALLGASPLGAQVPNILNYQGRIAVNNANFTGSGQFKFALVNAAGSITYWSNNGSSAAGSQPTAAVALTVTRGLYQVLLGDTTLPNMTAVPHSVFNNSDVRLRIWFNDGVNGFQQLAPDHRFAPAGYAMTAANVPLSALQVPPVQWVHAWGENTDGALNVPAGLTNVAQVAAGAGHSLARRSDGTLAAWGRNVEGQTNIPVAATSGVMHIAAGSSHSLAAKTGGTVVAWGLNNAGQCTVPGGLANVVQVAAGEQHSMARRSDGTVIVWGGNAFGQTTVPGGLTNVIAIAAGNDHCLALRADGTVAAWGRNDAGQTTLPGGLSNVTAIAAGAYHSLALKADGSVVAWGWDLGGQTTVPAGLVNVTAIEGGYAHSVAVKSDGAVIAWGDNAHGETTVPAGLGNAIAVSAHGTHTLALRAPLIPAPLARLDETNVFTQKVGIGRTPSTNMLEVEGPVSKTTAGNWSANSDRRIKTDIQPVTGALDLLDRLNPVTFRYTPEYLAQHPSAGGTLYYNVIAQEFREVFPDAVKSSGEKLPDGSDILQVDTYPATIAALAAIKELHAAVKSRDDEISALKARLERLEQSAAAK